MFLHRLIERTGSIKNEAPCFVQFPRVAEPGAKSAVPDCILFYAEIRLGQSKGMFTSPLSSSLRLKVDRLTYLFMTGLQPTSLGGLDSLCSTTMTSALHLEQLDR